VSSTIATLASPRMIQVMTVVKEVTISCMV